MKKLVRRSQFYFKLVAPEKTIFSTKSIKFTHLNEINIEISY